MEFTLGLLGGIGMVYGVVTSSWSEKLEPNKRINWTALVVLVFVIPAINILQSFETKKIIQLAERLSISDSIQFAFDTQIKVWLILVLFTILIFYAWKKVEDGKGVQSWGIISLALYSLLYMVFGNIRTGYSYSESFLGNSVTMYWVILPIILLLLYLKRENKFGFSSQATELESWKYWISVVVGLVLFIFVIALISTGTHDALPGSHNRF